MTKRFLIISLISAAAIASPVIAAAPTNPTPLNGTWKYEYSCVGATGVYADRCAAGERDNFTLSMAQSADKVCGWYEATVQLGNHVDDGDLSDWLFEPQKSGTFLVHFHLSGTLGEAVVHIDGNKMDWKLLKKQPDAKSDPVSWSFWPPESAVLVRQPIDQVRNPAKCDN